MPFKTKKKIFATLFCLFQEVITDLLGVTVNNEDELVVRNAIEEKVTTNI